jgi:hypothetical protein
VPPAGAWHRGWAGASVILSGDSLGGACLSLACLGKMILFSVKNGLKKAVFSSYCQVIHRGGGSSPAAAAAAGTGCGAAADTTGGGGSGGSHGGGGEWSDLAMFGACVLGIALGAALSAACGVLTKKRARTFGDDDA